MEKEREYKFTKYGHEMGSSHKPFGYHNSAKITEENMTREHKALLKQEGQIKGDKDGSMEVRFQEV